MRDVLGPTGKRIALQRLYPVTCPRCGKELTFDLGVKWEPNKILKCPKCGYILGGATVALEGRLEW